jgi:type II secretory pathway pseudopilin PulG
MICSKFQIPNSKFFFRGQRKGFTLIELLIYSAIFVMVGGLVTGIALNIKKNAALNEAQRTVDSAFNDLERRLASAIENSVSVDSITNGTLSLFSATNDNDNIFSLASNSVSYGEGTDAPAVITGTNVKVDVLNFKITPPSNVNIDPISHWAYNDIFGWIDFGQSGNSIEIPTGVGDLTGVAWGKGSGYVFLNCLSTDNCATSNYKVSVDTNGNLSGYAWSESMGWISFCGNPGGTNGCATSTTTYGVTINTNTGEFSGQAWSEVAGYISFNCATGSATNTSVCSTSNYKVQDLRRKTTSVTADIKISYNVAPYQNIFRSGSVTFNLKQPSKVTVTSVSPNTGAGVINNINVSGTYFKTGALVKLTQSGFKDIYPSTNFSRTSSTALNWGAIDTTGLPAGIYDVMVINPDGQIGILKNGFTIYTPAAIPVAGQLVIIPSTSGYIPGTVTSLTASFTSDTTVTTCEYTINGSTWTAATVSGTIPNFTCTKSNISGLTNGTSYIFNMRATNSGGTGTGTAQTRICDTVAPTNPTLTAIAGNTQVSLSWTQASDAGSGLNTTTPYKLVYVTGATAPTDCNSGTTIYSGTNTSYIHTGLTNGTQYSYRICAIDAVSNMSAGGVGSATPVSPAIYCDNDADGHYAKVTSGSCSGFYSSTVGDDCCDSDINAFPGQASFFATADACSNFDYNCDSVETQEYPCVSTASGGGCTNCSGTTGWVTSIPACGATANATDWASFDHGTLCGQSAWNFMYSYCSSCSGTRNIGAFAVSRQARCH